MHVRFIVEKHFLDEVDQLNDDGSSVPAYLAESIVELVPEDVRSNPYELELKEVNLSRVVGLVDIDFCLNIVIFNKNIIKCNIIFFHKP